MKACPERGKFAGRKKDRNQKAHAGPEVWECGDDAWKCGGGMIPSLVVRSSLAEDGVSGVWFGGLETVESRLEIVETRLIGSSFFRYFGLLFDVSASTPP
jgi:hypothetical protein